MRYPAIVPNNKVMSGRAGHLGGFRGCAPWSVRPSFLPTKGPYRHISLTGIPIHSHLP